MTTDKFEAAKNRLLLWCAMTDTERKLADEPLTDIDFAERYGVSPRWVSKWKNRPEFQAELEALMQRRLDENPVAPVAGRTARDAERELTRDEKWLIIVDQQMDLAVRGDQKALDWLRANNISKPFIDRMTAEFETDFPDQSDDELVETFLDAFTNECVAALRRRGYHVLAADAPEPAPGTPVPQEASARV